MTDYKLIYDAIFGTGGFSDGSYIDKFERESDERLKERRKIAWYDGVILPNTLKYIGYLVSKTQTRSSDDSIEEIIIRDIDGKGLGFSDYFPAMSLSCMFTGSVLAVVHPPDSKADNLSDNLSDRRTLPTAEFVPLNRIQSYRTDSNRLVEFTYMRGKQKTTVGENYIKVEADDKELITTLDYNPIVIQNANDMFPSRGEFFSVPQIAKRVYNLNSELDAILRGVTFPLLTFKSASKGTALEIGTNNALRYTEEKPSFLSPSSESAAIYEKRVERLEDKISKIMHQISTSKTESGVALEAKFQGLNSSLKLTSNTIMIFEKKLYMRMMQAVGKQSTASLIYPVDYSFNSVSNSLDVLERIKDMGYDLPEYEKEKLEGIVTNDLFGISQERLDAIRINIEDFFKTDTVA